MTAAEAGVAIAVLRATRDAAIGGAGTVIAAAGVPGAIVVALAIAIAAAFDAAAAFGTAAIRVEPDGRVVDTALDVAALTSAAYRSPGAFMIAAACSAYRSVPGIAADKAIAAVELGGPIVAGRGHFQQTAHLAKSNTAFTVGNADVVAADQAAAFTRHAVALMAEFARSAI